MAKKIIFLTITLVLILLLSTTALGKETIETHTVNITELENNLLVDHSMYILGDSDDYYETLLFWIPSGHTDLEILIDGKEPISKILVNQNTYECNLTDLNIEKNETIPISITYKLPLVTDEIEITLNHDTDSFTVIYKDEKILEGSDLSENSAFTIKLTEDTTIIEEVIIKDAYTMIYIALIVLLVLILLATIVLSKKTVKTKTSLKTTEGKTASKEYLTTKKALLMELLKEVEKKHRAKKISDETYNKLKDRYKQETIDAMRKLEDMK
jgi:hypothetical protein